VIEVMTPVIGSGGAPRLERRFVALVLAGLAAVAGPAAADPIPPSEPVVSRFLRYVKIDTQSQEGQTTVPSTAKQLDLARLLADELKALGAAGVRISDTGIVYARIPGNLPDNSKVPVVGLIAHLDTSPEVSGADVKAIVHADYRGGDIVLPGDPSQVITVAATPALKDLIGDDIITADGTTLLGSDDKAGCAAIMTLVDTLKRNPGIRHGTIAVAFTPDEEVGGGIETFDIAGFGASVAYTVDGGGLGEITNETWNAQTATVKFHGKNTHPGSAKGIMVNAINAAGDFVARLPTDIRPETTEGRVGFLHPYVGTLGVEESSLRILLRDFRVEGLQEKAAIVRQVARETEKKFPGVTVEVGIEDDYRNMNEVLKDHPRLIENAMEAARRAGLKPTLEAARGGTDGSRLTFRGLPCPDIFTGGHNFHGKLEFNSRRGLEKAAETLLHLVRIYAEPKASGEYGTPYLRH
jgi:tripeptide aminopeptidase